jgi:hypothetical protein
LALGGRRSAPLLNDVCQFVHEELLTCRRVGSMATCSEEDIFANRERVSSEDTGVFAG